MTAPLGTLRAAFESSGSPSWVMRVISERGFDRRRGFILDLGLGGDRGSQRAQATEAAVASGDADLIDTDWISIARSRQTGPGLVAIFPYGRIMGAVATAAGSALRTLADLPGRRIGVVRVLDKNWSVVRAASLQRHGFDPQAAASVSEALSKTTLVEWLETGRVEAAVVPWHIAPRLTAGGGYRQLCDVLDLLPDLAGDANQGSEADPGAGPAPTSFFAVRPDFAARHEALLAAFVAAYVEAVALMRADEQIWRAAAASPGDGADLLAGLRAAWSRRICCQWTAGDVRALQRLFERLKAVVGADALGVAETPASLFAPAFMH